MAATIDTESTPMAVREFYAFGSYVRGALEPNDLDVVVIHDRLPKATVEKLRREITSSESLDGDVLRRLHSKCESLMRTSLRRPGERIEVILAEELSHIVDTESKIPKDELILIWSPEDRDFESKIDAIPANPDAGRAPRNHFVNIKRLDTDITTMDKTMSMIEDGRLTLTAIRVEDINCDDLNDYHQKWLSHWIECKVLGKNSINLLPLAMSWFEQHDELCSVPRTEIWSKSLTHRVHVGRPSPGWMIGVFSHRPDVVRQCLIPHLRKKQENHLFAFERGPAFEQ